jgi:hypothetical protein
VGSIPALGTNRINELTTLGTAEIIGKFDFGLTLG